MSEEFASATATELVHLVRSKQVSPIELVESFLGRIDRLDTQLHSFLLVTRDDAMKSAADAEAAVMRGDQLGPLHGLPIAIKDSQMTGGIRTTQGSLLFKDRVPDNDAAVVERVKQAGAIPLGKTNLPEFGAGRDLRKSAGRVRAQPMGHGTDTPVGRPEEGPRPSPLA